MLALIIGALKDTYFFLEEEKKLMSNKYYALECENHLI